jgi:hypothetical protein
MVRPLDLQPSHAEGLEGDEFLEVKPALGFTGRDVAVVASRSGPAHVHIELWKTLAGGDRFENVVEPVTVLR